MTTGRDGGPVYPERGYPPTPELMPQGFARNARHALMAPLDMGQTWDSQDDPILNHPWLAKFTKVPAWYPVQVNLGGQDGDFAEAIEHLRPEPFLLRRITWATTGDTFAEIEDPGDSAWPFTPSQQGRCVEIEWGDEFTRMIPRQRPLVSALFGDSIGFLDLPGIMIFQGSQNLYVKLVRQTWPLAPLDVVPRFTTRWDFVFAGWGLLPKDIHQSGSVG